MLTCCLPLSDRKQETTLNTSTADWIIVVGHFPIFSAGENGPTPYLVERLLPMLARANVALYFSGHDHQLEHIGPSFWPVPTSIDFVVSGAGAKFNYSRDHIDDIPEGSLRYQYNQGCGFISVKVTHETFEQSALEVTFWTGADTMPVYTFNKVSSWTHFSRARASHVACVRGLLCSPQKPAAARTPKPCAFPLTSPPPLPRPHPRTNSTTRARRTCLRGPQPRRRPGGSIGTTRRRTRRRCSWVLSGWGLGGL